MAEIALAVLAHPDDAEFLCAGTLIRLARERQWAIHIATMTAGDCGSAEHSAAEITRIRRSEAVASAATIGATYYCVGERDLNVFYSKPTLARVTQLIRAVRPSLLFTHSPADYHLDHEQTSIIVRAAAFAAPVPLFQAGEGSRPAIDRIPHLYYCDALEGKDPFGQSLPPGFRIDISAVIDVKKSMLACHASQRNWLLHHHGIDEYLTAMLDWSAARGRECGVRFAEGFRQHLGHSYPQNNLLADLLAGV